MTDQPNVQLTAQIPADSVGLMTLVLGQLGDSERRILKRLDENAESARLR